MSPRPPPPPPMVNRSKFVVFAEGNKRRGRRRRSSSKGPRKQPFLSDAGLIDIHSALSLALSSGNSIKRKKHQSRAATRERERPT